MARLKTVGFEQNTLTADSELFFVFGTPQLVTNIDPVSGLVWNDGTGTWDSPTALWDGGGTGALYEPAGVRSGNFAIKLAVGGYISIKASTANGGGYQRVYICVKQRPDETTTVFAFQRASDSLDMSGIEMNPDGTLQMYYRNDAGVRTTVGASSNPLQVGQYYAVELGIIGDVDPSSTRSFEARLDHLVFAQAAATGQTATDGFLAVAPNIAAENTASTFEFYADDLATNDGFTEYNNTWPGPGKVVLLPITGDDQLVGNDGWTRGGIDTGEDWRQLADTSPPTDAASYMIGSDTSVAMDFRVKNPYDVGIRAGDTISAVVANIRWSMADETEGASVNVYLRAGSNLPKEGKDVDLFGVAWFTGDAAGQSPDVFSTATLPQSDDPWTTDELAAIRVGVEMVDSIPDVHLTSMWVLVDYAPYDEDINYSIEINGVDRTTDVELQSLRIQDQINEQVNTADFVLYDLHGLGAPVTDDEIIVSANGVRLFGGYVSKVGTKQLGVEADMYSISCVDYTHALDRRLVSMTIADMTDRQAIETIVSQYVDGEGITTYFVAENVYISQMTFNYIPASQAITQIAQQAGMSWYIDYFKRIHYFPVQQSQAPFQITPAGAFHKQLNLTEDNSRLRNRIYVRGGTELTTDPITETIVADGEQRQVLLAEKPHDTHVFVNGIEETMGIKNIDDPAAFDWLLNFQEKYIEAGTGRATPLVGDVIAVSYNYDVPILVSVENSDSIVENGVYEYVIIDNNISTTQQARDRATAELTDYASDIVDATYTTYEPGLRSGQYQRLIKPSRSVNDDYLINTVTLRSLGGGEFVYEAKLTNAKTMGILKFLLDMLQVDRRVGKIDPNEKVDQLFTLIDTIDSFMDSLISDSGPTKFKWADDLGSVPTVSTNMVINPDFETNISNWTAIGVSVTLTNDTSQHYVGSRSLKYVKASTDNHGVVSANTANGDANTKYSATLAVKTDDMNNVTVQLLHNNVVIASKVVVGNGSWQVVTLTGTTSGVAAAMKVSVTSVTAPAVYVDAVQIEKGDPTPYFSGATADTTNYDYAWTGTANASASTRTVLSVPANKLKYNLGQWS